MSEGALLLPHSLIDELAEERALKIARERRLARDHAGPPIVYQSNAVTLGGLGRQPAKTALLEENVGWSAIAGTAKASRIMSLDPQIRGMRRTEQGGVESFDLPEHEAKNLLDHPGDIFSRAMLLWLTSFHLDQIGEAYWQILRDGIGIPRELWPMPPQHVEPIPHPEMVISGYRVISSQGSRDIPREDVIRFWKPDPETLFSSVGSLGPQRSEWDADRFRIETIRTHFSEGAIPRTALKAESGAMLPMGDERDAFNADWMQRYHQRKGRDRGVPAFLPPGFDVVHLDQYGGVNDTLEWGEKVAEQILAAYGVPGAIVGMMVDVNRAAAETARWTFDQFTIQPITKLISMAITDQLLRPNFGQDVICEFAPFVSPDKDFDQRQEFQDLATKVRVINEVRADRDGLEPVEWGNEPVGSIADSPYRPDEEFGEESAADLDGPRASGDSSPFNKSDREPQTRALDFFDPRSVEKRMVAVEKKNVSKMTRALGGVWEVQRKETIARLHRMMPGSSSGEASRVVAEQIFNPDDWADLYKARVQPLLESIATDAAAINYSALTEAGAFNFTPLVAQQIASQATLFQFQVSTATQKFIARELGAGVAGGESVDQIAKRIDGVFKDRKRARTIARTEVGKSNQQGTLIGYQTSGVVESKRWNSSDVGVRPSHQIDGQEVRLNEMFTLGDGEQANAPLDPALSAKNLINCRCFMTPVLGEGDE